jgi:CheY-like chemotaxis protein
LVADDSIAVRKVAERLLTEAGFGVALAANGEEAMAYLAKDRADVVVTDVIMPDKSGYEVCAFIRSNSQLASTPVLLISGIVNDEVAKQADSCRADGVLKKPFQGSSLKDKVLELLAKRQPSSAVSSPAPSFLPAQASGPTQPGAVFPPPSPVQVHPPSPAHVPMREGALDADRRPVQAGQGEPQLLAKMKEVEGQLRAEQARAESLAKRIVDLEGELGRAKEAEGLLEAERRRVIEWEAKARDAELQASRIPQLEASLRIEQESAEKARREAVAMKEALGSVAELEAALDTERVAAAQLVQQITELEASAARGKHAEAMLARELEQNAEFKQKAVEAETQSRTAAIRAAELESELASARQKLAEAEQHVARFEAAATKTQELEGLLEAERDRTAVLVRKVADAEQTASNATRRFEELVRKLAEIAGLASQLGKGTGGA